MTPNSFDNVSEVKDSPSSLPSVKKRGISKWLVRFLALSLIAGCGYIGYNLLVSSRQQGNQRPAPVPVERTNLKVTVTANGTVEPKELVNVSPKTAGVLKSLQVAEGDAVEQGQELARMDNSDLLGKLTEAKGKLAQAEANLNKLIAGNRPQEIAQAQAKLEQLEANLSKLIAGNRPQEIAEAQARLDSAKATYERAKDEFTRYKLLNDEGAISTDTLKQKRANFDTAEASMVANQQALDLLKVGTRQEDIDQARAEVKQQKQVLDLLKVGTRQEEIDQARAEVTSAQGTLQTVQNEINDTIIRAPFSGIISRKYSDPGSFVTPTTAGSSVSSATSSSILSLASTNQVSANVSESNIARIRTGQSVVITADAYPGETFQGTVSTIAPQASVEQNVTSFEVDISLEKVAAQRLRSGMNVSAAFQVDELKNVLTVPSVAVTLQNKVTGVYVGGPNQPPKFVPITTGATVNNRTEVKSGLTGNEHILINVPAKPSASSGFSWLKLLGGSSEEGPPGGGPPGGGPPGGGGPSGGGPSGGGPSP